MTLDRICTTGEELKLQKEIGATVVGLPVAPDSAVTFPHPW